METQIEFISLGEALIVAPRKEFEWSGVKKKKKKKNKKQMKKWKIVCKQKQTLKNKGKPEK